MLLRERNQPPMRSCQLMSWASECNQASLVKHCSTARSSSSITFTRTATAYSDTRWCQEHDSVTLFRQCGFIVYLTACVIVLISQTFWGLMTCSFLLYSILWTVRRAQANRLQLGHSPTKTDENDLPCSHGLLQVPLLLSLYGSVISTSRMEGRIKFMFIYVRRSFLISNFALHTQWKV